MRRRSASARRLRDGILVERHPFVQPQHDSEQRRQQQRLGHRRRLQVQQVRIERQQRRGGRRAERRSGRGQDQARGGIRGDAEAGDRDQRRERAGPVEEIDLRREAALMRWGSGSQTAPICCQPGVMLSMMRRATTRWAWRRSG